MRALIAVILLAFVATAHAEWRVAPNADAIGRPAYWVADVNGVRVEAILNDYRVAVGTQCLGQEVRPAGAYSLRWIDFGPNPLAGICRWVSDGTEPPDPPTEPVLRNMEITWEHNGTRTDGAPATLSGFVIHPAHNGDAQTPVAVPDGAARSHTLTGLAAGEWCFTVTAIEGELESAHSSPVVCATL